MLSGDGRVVAFTSEATNLVATDTNAVSDVLVRDRQTSTTTRISVSSTGAQGNRLSLAPAISDDGNIVVFISEATTLVSEADPIACDFYCGRAFVHERTGGQTARAPAVPGTLTTLFPLARNLHVTSLAVAATGRFVAVAVDGTDFLERFLTTAVQVYDRASAELTFVTRNNFTSDGVDISADGRHVAKAGGANALNPLRPPIVVSIPATSRTNVALSAHWGPYHAAEFGVIVESDGPKSWSSGHSTRAPATV